ncbi:MAG: 3'-5' exonuclease [Streptomyces sp.]|nr:3'-5' exonuclease [Streptomyces sp.]NUS24385.1 3'-5' exonuclease [Streptomyces sp.]
MTAPWWQREWLAIDLETTGLDVETDRIVSAALVWGNGGEPAETHTWLTDVGGADIPADAVAIHGIRTVTAHRHGRPLRTVVEEITRHITRAITSGTPVIAANAPFDLTMLDRELGRQNLGSLVWQTGQMPLVLDPLVIDRQVDRYRDGPRSLAGLCKHHKVNHLRPHQADADAIAAARVMHELVRLHPQLREVDLPTLHQQQSAWARQQDAARAEHRRRGGHWPLTPRPQNGDHWC